MVVMAGMAIYTFILVEENAHNYSKFLILISKYFLICLIFLGQISSLTWEKYREECGFAPFSANPR